MCPLPPWSLQGFIKNNPGVPRGVLDPVWTELVRETALGWADFALGRDAAEEEKCKSLDGPAGLIVYQACEGAL